MSSTTVGDDGLLQVAGGTNRYGLARPDTILMRGADGNLDPRFLQTMSPEYQKLQGMGMAEGDTESARLMREQQGLMTQQSRDALQRQGASAMAGGMQNLAMRGGASGGARERLGRDVGRSLMSGSQGISRENRLANIGISQQDQQMKNQLMGQTGMIGQQIQEGNINRLAGDIQNQNLAAQNMYGEDMQAYGAQKTADAQSAAACFVAGTEFLMCNGDYKKIEEIDLNDRMRNGGKVHFLTKSITNNLYSYKGDFVSGTHAVCEDGKWVRVQDSELAEREKGDFTVYCVGNENHIMRSKNAHYSDFFETDEYEQLSIEESLEKLNEALG